MCVKPELLLLAGLALSFVDAPAVAGDTDVRALSERLEALSDNSYVGGMALDMQAIAKQARQIAQDEAGRPLRVCESFNPMRGTLVNEKQAPASPGAPTLPVVEMLAGHLSSLRPIVRDTAAYALGEIGPDALAALEGKKFAASDWSPWQSHAGGRLRCERLSLGRTQRVIPEAIAKEWLRTRGTDQVTSSTAQRLTLLAERALHEPSLRWPDHLFQEWLQDTQVEKGDTIAPEVIRALGDVVADARRPVDLRQDVAQLIETWHQQAVPAAPGLRTALMDQNEGLAYAAATALLAVGSEPGSEGAAWLLAHDVNASFYFYELCALGPASASRLTPLYIAALASPNWMHAESAAELLGCVEARDAVGPLLAALDRPVWRIQRAAARTLRKLAPDRSDVRDRLDMLAKGHWSGLVRTAASPDDVEEKDVTENALDSISLRCFGRCEVDHGNHSCAGDDIRDGVYAIDGGRPFRVRWHRAQRNAPPKGFPITLRQDSREDYGTSTFLRVPGGWLYGTDRWHYDGEFGFVTDGGERSLLPAYGSEPVFLAELPGFGRIAMGRGLFSAEDAGVLSILSKDANGNWQFEPRIALPTVPHAWATSPDGQLLVADPDNAVAVSPTGRIVNLECPRQDRHGR